jgi:hypothetical protein
MPLLVALMLLVGSLTGCVSDMTGAEEEAGPRTLQVERAEGGRTSVSGQHAPFATAKARYVTGQNMMSTEATVTALGSVESPSAFSAVYNDWSNEAGRYRVTANVNWNGALVLNGFQGQTAAVKIELKIYTFEGTLLARERIHTRSLEQSGVALPSDVVDRAGDSVVLDFDVPENTGGPFRIQFETTCSAGSAALAAGTHCGYNVNWSRLEVTQF